MSEIIGVVDVRAAEGRADAVVAAFEACTLATHEEPGCLVYALHRDTSDPHHFVLVERWRSQEDLDAHFATAHTQALLAFAGEPGNLAQPPSLTFTTSLGLGTPDKGSLQALS
jgi:quinol monooxygenase YgiN